MYAVWFSANAFGLAPLQVPGLVNVDFADVRTIIAGAGSSLMGQGRASGKERARDAALAAISSPLLDVGIERATGIVWNITGPPDLTLFEVSALQSWEVKVPGGPRSFSCACALMHVRLSTVMLLLLVGS